MTPQVVLVAGASSGIGESCARWLHANGFVVYAGSRSPASGAPFQTVRLDVRDDASIQDALAHIVQRDGRIDAVVNSAGNGIAGSIEDTSAAEAMAQFETNFFGALRLAKAVMPLMRRQRYGRIIQIGSLGGLVAIPFQGLYSASKFALEGAMEAMRIEVLPFGVHVVLVDPADVRTQFTANRTVVASASGSAYHDLCAKALAVCERNEAAGFEPERVARRVGKILRHPRPVLRYVVGPPFERAAPLMKFLLPQRLTEWMTLRYFGLS